MTGIQYKPDDSLVDAIAWQIAKDNGYAHKSDAMAEAQQVANMQADTLRLAEVQYHLIRAHNLLTGARVSNKTTQDTAQITVALDLVDRALDIAAKLEEKNHAI